ncbi:MAG: sugar phosphate isomerase/epimerase [Acidobacteriaceae bacterium]|nr:sugar phosphate isomerase/epimerase [Acidobacteriaceae bacterium]
MKFGVNTFIWSDRFDKRHAALLPALKQAGFDGVELPLVDLHPSYDRDIRAALEQNQLECTFCSVIPGGLSVIDEDAGIRRKTKQHLEDCVRTAAEMGGRLIAGPLYSPVGYLPGRRRTRDEWKRAVESFQQLGPMLDNYGVTLAIEPLNRYETYFLNTVSDAVLLCREIGHPKVGILFDTYHANIEEKNIADALRQAGSYLKHVHSCENDRGIPGSGHIEWPAIVEALRQLRYEGWLTIEGFGFSLGALSAAASIWRDLAPEPGAIAFEGLRFLRARLAT